MVVSTILNKFKVVELAGNPASFVLCSKTRMTIDITSKENFQRLPKKSSKAINYILVGMCWKLNWELRNWAAAVSSLPTTCCVLTFP